MTFLDGRQGAVRSWICQSKHSATFQDLFLVCVGKLCLRALLHLKPREELRSSPFSPGATRSAVKATGAKAHSLIAQVYARRGCHGPSPALPCVAFPRRRDRGLALAGSGGAPRPPQSAGLHDLPLLPASPRTGVHPAAHLPLHQGLIAHGEHLKHRCSGWSEDLHRQRGWAPEVA